jgi:hypothetical protein
LFQVLAVARIRTNGRRQTSSHLSTSKLLMRRDSPTGEVNELSF